MVCVQSMHTQVERLIGVVSDTYIGEYFMIFYCLNVSTAQVIIKVTWLYILSFLKDNS